MISCIWNKVKENDTFLFCHNKKTDDLTKNVTFLLRINVQNAQKYVSKTVKNVKNNEKNYTIMTTDENIWNKMKINANKNTERKVLWTTQEDLTRLY